MKDTNLNELLFSLYEEEIEELKTLSEEEITKCVNKMKEIEVIYKDRLRDSLVLTVRDKMQNSLKSIVEKFNELESRIIKNKLDYSLLWKCEYAKANLISIMMDIEEMCN